MNEVQRKKYLLGVGNRVKSLRLARDMSQDELAKKSGYSSRSTINKIELGINDIPQSKVVEIAKALNTTPAHLMGWDTAEYTAPEDREFVGQMLKNPPPLESLSEEAQALKYLLNQFGYDIVKSTSEKDKYFLKNLSGGVEIEEDDIKEMSKGATDQLKIIADKLIYKYLAKSFGGKFETPTTQRGNKS